MVDVGAKKTTRREAWAEAALWLPECVVAAFSGNELESKKGPVMQTARLAGTMAVKKTPDLIPLCHPIPIEGIDFEHELEELSGLLTIRCRVSAVYKTGIEMEALTGVSIATLTVYDMCKAISPEITIQSIRVLHKTGGKKDYHAE